VLSPEVAARLVEFIDTLTTNMVAEMEVGRFTVEQLGGEICKLVASFVHVTYAKSYEVEESKDKDSEIELPYTAKFANEAKLTSAQRLRVNAICAASSAFHRLANDSFHHSNFRFLRAAIVGLTSCIEACLALEVPHNVQVACVKVVEAHFASMHAACQESLAGSEHLAAFLTYLTFMLSRVVDASARDAAESAILKLNKVTIRLPNKNDQIFEFLYYV